MTSNLSWGNYPKVNQNIIEFSGLKDLNLDPKLNYLPQGLARSYGDSCLNDNSNILLTKKLDHFISFDEETGILHAESGVSLNAIIKTFLHRGWFLPVSPGTQFVTLGGAIANDIHGKNHHTSGAFGNHIEEIELLRSSGEKLICSLKENSDLFKATISGLGLTGLILSAKLKLKKVNTAFIDVESIKFNNLDEFFEITKDSDKDFEYTVAWLDCLHKDNRGIFMRGNHFEDKEKEPKYPRKINLGVPFNLPSFTLNKFTVRAFNELYFHKQRTKIKKDIQFYEPFFYPLDSVHNWNRIYGSKGFLQFQSVMPKTHDNAELKGLLKKVSESKLASFLAVIKEFGDIKSPGMLSFPRRGVTLCMDFPCNNKSLKLISDLEQIVVKSGGAMYPAKDACMQGENFKKFFPKYEEFKKYIDPVFSSSFWRRVMGENK